MVVQLSDASLAWLSGGIGLFGVLAGSGIGLATTLIQTARQVARDERNVRRTIYAEYVSCSLELSHLLSNERRAWVDAMDTRKTNNTLVREIEHENDPAAVAYLSGEVAKVRSRADRRTERLQTIMDEFGPVHHRQLSRAHELKIHAPELIHDAAMCIYSSMEPRSRFTVEPSAKLLLLESEALQVFSALARSDARSPGAQKYKRAAATYEPKVRALEVAIATVAQRLLFIPQEHEVSILDPSSTSAL
jgi:hypothetical protein